MRVIFITILILFQQLAFASYILIPMDENQKNHLKAYGIAYWSLQNDIEVSWLLNYKGGSFITTYLREVEEECMIRGVSYNVIADFQAKNIFSDIARPDINMDRIKLEKAPKIAVYSPKSKLPWDDAVTMVLTYSEIPYDIIYDKEIVEGDLSKYDWLHLHHEDFTGQYGKFYGNYRNTAWYVANKRDLEALAADLGFAKVSKMKKFVVQTIRDYVTRGGFLFAMCSATDTYDIALAATDIDICGPMFDGDAYDQDAQNKLDFTKTFAFKDFTISMDPFEYEFSNIDVTNYRKVPKTKDYFNLFEFSAKWDPVPTMLCQNHETMIQGFMGQTTSFNKDLIKSNVLIMGEYKAANEARYIHGEYGKGTWTFYGGHDPADYQHFVGDPKTNLDLHPNSSGYRLILNNILFPAAKKKKMKT
ncbi:MAG: asparagine synthetase B [Bacteroidetes bacterium 4572_117]|nr:MAG: asparagine synthetase B [Bacteroidetes bacterium 4572_117]